MVKCLILANSLAYSLTEQWITDHGPRYPDRETVGLMPSSADPAARPPHHDPRGLLRPALTLQEPRQTGQPPFK